MARARKQEPGKSKTAPSDLAEEGIVGLRIIGGKHRGRSLDYSGEHRTRPMKDRVRESLFNLLGTRCTGKHVIDLFAGTGALALEAISRGAKSAIMLERHYPTCQLIEQNVKQLGLEEQAKVSFGNSFLWARKPVVPSDIPWVVFCSPPYEFYESRREETIELLQRLYDASHPRKARSSWSQTSGSISQACPISSAGTFATIRRPVWVFWTNILKKQTRRHERPSHAFCRSPDCRHSSEGNAGAGRARSAH